MKALLLQDIALSRAAVRKRLRAVAPAVTPIWFDQFKPSQVDSVSVLVTKEHSVSAAIVNRFPELRALICAFTGYEQVDLQLCRERGIQVYYAPSYSVQSVSELAVAMAFSLLRNLLHCDRNVRRGKWDSGGVQPGVRLSGRTVGILGTGAIGINTCRLFRSLGCPVWGFSRSRRKDFLIAGGRYVGSLKDLLRCSQILVVHVPHTEETHHLLGARALRLMRRDAILINVSRGAIVDTSALVAALRNGRLLGAGLDVFENEPVRKSHPLCNLKSALMTPHVGFKEETSLRTLAEVTIDNIGRWCRGDATNRISL